jgi:PleD family two-component response regulator
MNEAKQKILIVEDDVDVADMLNAFFCVQGYEVLVKNWGEEGVRACQDSQPDLLILDIHLPDIDGFEVARQLHSDRRTADIPIIFLTERSEHLQQLQWLELGTDDYMAKPFDMQELRTRVHNALQRSEQDTMTNAITGLPEGIQVDEHVADCLRRSDWVLLGICLENLDAFSEIYGLPASNEVLRSISLMVHNIARYSGGQEDFLGHIGATDFVVITKLERHAKLRESIRGRLKQSLEYFYPIKDREQDDLHGKRLDVRISVLQPMDGVFTSLDSLKSALFPK